MGPTKATWLRPAAPPVAKAAMHRDGFEAQPRGHPYQEPLSYRQEYEGLWSPRQAELREGAKLAYPPSIRGMKNTSASGGTGWKYPVSWYSPLMATVVSSSRCSPSPGNNSSIAFNTPRRFFASTSNSRTPLVYRRAKPEVKTTRAVTSGRQRGQQTRRRHRQFRHPLAGRHFDGVGDGGHRRADTHLA